MKRTGLYPFWTWVFWALGLPLLLMALAIVVVASTDLGNVPFDHPGLWWLGGAVPLGSLLVLFGVYRRARALRRFSQTELAELLAARVSPGRQAVRAGLFLTALLLLVAAILGPRWGESVEKRQVHGVDIVVALDLSRSMLAEDLSPNRLEYARQAIRQQLTERPIFRRANRLALVIFAGTASLRIPLTTDHLAFREKLEQVRYGDVPRGGTDITTAITAAQDLFRASPPEATRAILLFTDGEDHEGDAVAAAKAAYDDDGIRVFTVGIGDPASVSGAQVPAQPGASSKPLLYDGQIVFSKLDVDGLRRIASAGGGDYAPVQGLYRLVSEIANLWTAQLSTEERRIHLPRYQYFLSAAMLLLVIEAFMADHRRGRAPLPRRSWMQEGTA